MTRALTEMELGALERAAAVGFHREAPPVPAELRRDGDDAPALTLLAYAAHQQRLTVLPPRAPAGITRYTAPEDPRPVLPAAARGNLLRLVRNTRRLKADALIVPVGWALRARGYRLHPFDTDLLAPLRAAAGPYEWWLAEQAGTDLGDESAVTAVDDTAWTTLPPAQRAAWLRRRRHEDPEAARALLEAVWSTEKADVRLRLLAALETRLGVKDAPFLVSLVNDRSTHVRDLAARLATLAGAELTDEKFAAELVSKITFARKLVVGPKRAKLRDGVDKAGLFAGIASRPLGPTLALLDTDLEVLQASDAIADLLPAFALAALLEGRVDVHEALIRAALQHGWDPNDGSWRARMLAVPREARAAALAPLLAGALIPAIAASLGSPADWLRLLDGPLPPAGSRALRATKEWRALIDALRESTDVPRDQQALAAVAALVPGADARAAVADLDAVGSHAAPLVRLTWTLLADLDTPEGAP